MTSKPYRTLVSAVRYQGKLWDAETGDRLTDCCGVYATYDETGVLYCKHCYHAVEPGQGDGGERVSPEVLP